MLVWINNLLFNLASLFFRFLSFINFLPALPKPDHPISKYAIVSHTDIEAEISGVRVLVRVFYPVKHEGNPSTWLTHYDYGSGYGNFLNFPVQLVGFIVNAIIGHVLVPGGQDGIPAQAIGDEFWPVCVFSHGLATWRSHYTSICMAVAAQGVVVASVEQRDGSAVNSTALNGDVNENVSYESLDALLKNYKKDTPERWNKMFSIRKRQLRHRVKECSATLDVLKTLKSEHFENEAKFVKLSGNFDIIKSLPYQTEDVFIIGHSFGGGTAIATASTDHRFTKVVAIDPWLHPIPDDMFNKSPKASILVVTASYISDYWVRNLSVLEKYPIGNVENVENTEKALAHEKLVSITIRGSSHTDFSDAPLFCPSPLSFVYRFVTKGYDGLFNGLETKKVLELSNLATIDFIFNKDENNAIILHKLAAKRPPEVLLDSFR